MSLAQWYLNGTQEKRSLCGRQPAENPGWLTLEKGFYSGSSPDSAMHASASPSAGSVPPGEDVRARQLPMPVTGVARLLRPKVVVFLAVDTADKDNTPCPRFLFSRS